MVEGGYRRKCRVEKQRPACTRKIRYPDLVSATEEAKRLNEVGGGPLESYFCENCQGYHVGHMSVKRIRRQRWEEGSG